MSSATMTSKGRITIPKDIRKAVGLKSNDQISFTLFADRHRDHAGKKRSLSELYGILHVPDRAPLAPGDMKAWC